MPKLSAGIIVYRRTNESVELLLVHPGGPFWAKKDNGAWSVPKGEYADGEDSLKAAEREFKEETGFEAPAGDYIALGEVAYSNKRLTVWAVEGNLPAENVKSNYFEMQWPPKSGKIQQFPEVDRAGWYSPYVAKKKLVAGQAELVNRLLDRLGVAEKQAPEDQDSQLALF